MRAADEVWLRRQTVSSEPLYRQLAAVHPVILPASFEGRRGADNLDSDSMFRTGSEMQTVPCQPIIRLAKKFLAQRDRLLAIF